jgi:hypothetical protein
MSVFASVGYFLDAFVIVHPHFFSFLFFVLIYDSLILKNIEESGIERKEIFFEHY